MKKLIFTMTAIAALSSCNKEDLTINQNEIKNQKNATKASSTLSSKSGATIAFSELKNYFSNQSPSNVEEKVFLSKFDFEDYYSSASYMGGTPTSIDWNNEIVISIALPETFYDTKIIPISLTESGNWGDYNLNYKIEIGEKRTYKTIPFLAIKTDSENIFFEDDITFTSITQKANQVAFTKLQSYFINEAPSVLEEKVFFYENNFEDYYSSATYMGGIPTSINWNSEIVISIALPKTYNETKILPVSLIENENGGLTFNYKIELGPKNTYLTKPSLSIKTNGENIYFEDDVTFNLVN